jgi:dipeptidase E
VNIVAIGGGDVGAGETLPMDQELVRLAGKPSPHVLFIPTASDDSLDYAERVNSTYSKLGCSFETLLLWSVDGDSEIARQKIERADLVYVGGGNTKKMIALWKEFGVDGWLKRHLDSGKPAGGVSAGAICWFRVGNSDWPIYEAIPGINTARLDCLGFVDLVACPHTAREGFRLGDFREMMKTEQGPGIGIDDCCAIQIRGGEYRILSSAAGARAHRIEWRGGGLDESILEPHPDFRPLSDLKKSYA